MVAKGLTHPSPTLSLPVQVLYGGRRFRSALVRSLTAQGMSLVLRNLTLPAGTRVELEVDIPGRDWRGEAVVVRSAGAEVSVLFRVPQPELIRDLERPAALGVPHGELAARQAPLEAFQRPRLSRH